MQTKSCIILTNVAVTYIFHEVNWNHADQAVVSYSGFDKIRKIIVSVRLDSI